MRKSWYCLIDLAKCDRSGWVWQGLNCGMWNWATSSNSNHHSFPFILLPLLHFHYVANHHDNARTHQPQSNKLPPLATFLSFLLHNFFLKLSEQDYSCCYSAPCLLPCFTPIFTPPPAFLLLPNGQYHQVSQVRLPHDIATSCHVTAVQPWRVNMHLAIATMPMMPSWTLMCPTTPPLLASTLPSHTPSGQHAVHIPSLLTGKLCFFHHMPSTNMPHKALHATPISPFTCSSSLAYLANPHMLPYAV